jgi:DMSO/TMAO reductase YedYZ heme-binding membrane subunit
MIDLAVKPLHRLSGWPWWGRIRPMLRLFAFLNISLSGTA